MKEHFEVEIYLDKSKIKKIYLVGLILFLISIVCVVWAKMNWEDYTILTQNVLTGKVKEKGLAPTLYGWGLGFVIAIPIIYGLMWSSFDFKNPSIAANKEGLFLNKEFFKKTFINWNEFSNINQQENGELHLTLKNPEGIVDQQKGIGKAFLKQTYVKDRSPITLDPADSEKYAELVDYITHLNI
ncbi:MAG: hypothetical protein KDD41_03545 [Flavobacteriales bacterium]|nr:hypothetical protein [Flavobacteriales bacterium]